MHLSMGDRPHGAALVEGGGSIVCSSVLYVVEGGGPIVCSSVLYVVGNFCVGKFRGCAMLFCCVNIIFVGLNFVDACACSSTIC